jgi:hypothetical protein
VLCICFAYAAAPAAALMTDMPPATPLLTYPGVGGEAAVASLVLYPAKADVRHGHQHHAWHHTAGCMHGNWGQTQQQEGLQQHPQQLPSGPRGEKAPLCQGLPPDSKVLQHPGIVCCSNCWISSSRSTSSSSLQVCLDGRAVRPLCC